LPAIRAQYSIDLLFLRMLQGVGMMRWCLRCALILCSSAFSGPLKEPRSATSQPGYLRRLLDSSRTMWLDFDELQGSSTECGTVYADANVNDNFTDDTAF